MYFFSYNEIDFVSIASILGTGILGLPVTLSESGFQPFVISFLICYVIQVKINIKLDLFLLFP